MPYVLFSWAIRRVDAPKASLIVLLEPILNPLFTWIAVREPVPKATLIGGPMIILSVLAWLSLSWRHAAQQRDARSQASPCGVAGGD
jgi:drug/metabolite transporter (DMT)-like permease